MANERGNLLDRRKFHMMKSGSPQPPQFETVIQPIPVRSHCTAHIDRKMRRPARKAWWNPEEVVKEVTSRAAGVVLEVVLG